MLTDIQRIKDGVRVWIQNKETLKETTPESYLEELLFENPNITPADINHRIHLAKTPKEKDLLIRACGILLNKKFREVVIQQNNPS